jgi:hypothetical protein
MELEVEDSDDDVLEPETDEVDESEENMQTDFDEEEMLKSKRKKKGTKEKKSEDKVKFCTIGKNSNYCKLSI